MNAEPFPPSVRWHSWKLDDDGLLIAYTSNAPVPQLGESPIYQYEIGQAIPSPPTDNFIG